MARRIDIELTSARPDGTWTWRAAGAMQPRGVLDGQLLYPEAKAGDVARADADFELDGISIVSVTAPKPKKRAEPERIELIAPTGPSTGVTTQLVGRGDRGDRRPSERGRSGRDEGRSNDTRGGRGRTGERPSRDSPGRDGSGDRPGQGKSRPAIRRPGADGAGVGGRPPQNGASSERSTSERSTSDRSPSDRSSSSSSSERAAGERDRRRREAPAPSGEGRPSRSRPERSGAAPSGPDSGVAAGRRLNPGNVHRQAVMTSLSPEQQAIAEQVLRGGIPAVRTAIHLEREKATAEGRQAPNADSLLAIAEELLPRLKGAEWRDRAEAAAKAADNLALRDLRSVVAGGDLARDDETRQLAANLREMLETRLSAMRDEWAQEIAHQLDEGRVVRALRIAARAPEATTRLSAEQAERLRAAASAAMSPDTAPDRWIALLEAVAASPVRRTVTPVGLPPEPGAALSSAAQQQVGRIPALAALLGISMPPPPGPTRPQAASRPAPPRRRGPRRPDALSPPTAEAPPTLSAATTAPVDTTDSTAVTDSTEVNDSPAVSVEGAATPDNPAGAGADEESPIVEPERLAAEPEILAGSSTAADDASEAQPTRP